MVTSYGLICTRNDDSELLMVQRRDSLNFMSFVKGNFESSRLDYMTHRELDALRTRTFSELWLELWKYHVRKPPIMIHKVKQFDEWRNNGNLISLIDEAYPRAYDQPEWGFPKGRPESHELGMTCAIREFSEETGYSPDDVVLMSACNPLIEEFTGTDGSRYRHVYYMAQLKPEARACMRPDKGEVINVHWVPVSEVLPKFRSYEAERKKKLLSGIPALVKG